MKTSVRWRFPREGWAEYVAGHGSAARIFRSDVPILHFYTDFEAFVRQKNRRHSSLREPPLAATIAGVLFFKEPVHGPFDAPEEFLGEEQTNFVGIGNLGRAAFFLLSSSP